MEMLKCNTSVYCKIRNFGDAEQIEMSLNTDKYQLSIRSGGKEQSWLWRQRAPMGGREPATSQAAGAHWALHAHTEAGLGICVGAFSISQIQLCSTRVRGSGTHSKFYECSAGWFQSPKASDQILWSFVIISTLTIWSNELQMQRPLLSGLQSTLEMGWVDNVTFCRRLTEPATPISTPSESVFDRWTGYSLRTRTKR